MIPFAELKSRAYWWTVKARDTKERALRRLWPSRMRFVTYSWPLLPAICPCDLDLCDYLRERGVRGKAVFHFGSGGHHLVGLRNREDGLGNDVLAVTASPSEHAAYVRRVVRDPSLGAGYRVLFADIYDLGPAALPRFDVVTLFHLCEFSPPGGGRRLDDRGLLDLFVAKLAPGGRLLFYERSEAWARARPLVEEAVASGRLRVEERYRTLLVCSAPSV
jgi:hypothetical protein